MNLRPTFPDCYERTDIWKHKQAICEIRNNSPTDGHETQGVLAMCTFYLNGEKFDAMIHRMCQKTQTLWTSWRDL